MMIDIERLIDAVCEENDYYNDYVSSSKKLYQGDWETLGRRKQHMQSMYNAYNSARDSVYAISDILKLDSEQRNKLYIAARAISKWRVRTNWERLISETMQEQLYKFIFSK